MKNLFFSFFILLAWGLATGTLIRFPDITVVQNAGYGDESSCRKGSASLNLDTFPAVIRQIEDDMVKVEGGSFIIGNIANPMLSHLNEKWNHEVQIKDFSIGRYEVTQMQWRAVMGDNSREMHHIHNEGCDSCPVESISWREAHRFIAKLNQITGKQYRLPTEAEWEYAAKGGKNSKGYLFSGSDKLEEVGWYSYNSPRGRKEGFSVPISSPVGGKKPNELGIYDMAGNVWEWVEDDLREEFFGVPKDGSAWMGTPRSSHRVCRGGGFESEPLQCQITFRLGWAETGRGQGLGFRLAL